MASVDLTAYRPQHSSASDLHFDHTKLLDDRRVPDTVETSPRRGPGIRINGDNASETDEDDLIRVDVAGRASSGNPLTLSRNNPNLELYRSAERTGAVFGDRDTVPIADGGQTLWAEWTGGNDPAPLPRLTLEAGSGSQDLIRFHPFDAHLTFISGEGADPGDFPGGPEFNNAVLARELAKEGYDTHLIEEPDPRAGESHEPAVDMIEDAVRDHGVTEVGITGMSHGGGSVFQVAQGLAERNVWSETDARLAFTGYMDAVTNPGTSPEDRRPPETEFLANLFQTSEPFRGADMPNAEINKEFGLDHGGIATEEQPRQTIREALTNQIPLEDDSNLAPTARNTSVRVSEATGLRIDPTTNDSDPNADPLTVAAITDPRGGSASITDNDSIAFDPTNGLQGDTRIGYKLSDGRGETATASIRINLESPDFSDDFLLASGFFSGSASLADAISLPDQARQVRIFDTDAGNFVTPEPDSGRGFFSTDQLGAKELTSGKHLVQFFPTDENNTSPWGRFNAAEAQQESFVGLRSNAVLAPGETVGLDFLIDTSSLAESAQVRVVAPGTDIGFSEPAALAEATIEAPATGESMPLWVDTWLRGEGRSGWGRANIEAESGGIEIVGMAASSALESVDGEANA